jgi:hypothetical protein
MTTENDEILTVLKAILGMIRWVGVPVLIGLASLVVIMVADHYEQVGLAKDRDDMKLKQVELAKDRYYMKPRVQHLWKREHPEDL